ncbi:MAG: DUF131 domain-containing protein [Candidatus Thermoplasmatota archaeon]|nr:DUF131 domain-containing protein [Candidatus Thermoplasmatota archaeon]
MRLRPIIWVPIAVFVSGMACIAAAVMGGEGDVRLFLIFPVFSGSSWLFILGTLLIVLSFFVGFAMIVIGGTEADRSQLGSVEPNSPAPTQRKTTYGGVVLVGPIPIAFASSKNMAIFMLIIGIALAMVFLGVLLVH